MITYEEALKKAKEKNPDIDYCVEYQNAFRFDPKSDTDEIIIGGDDGTPVVIMKEDGRDTVLQAVIGKLGDIVREFEL